VSFVHFAPVTPHVPRLIVVNAGTVMMHGAGGLSTPFVMVKGEHKPGVWAGGGGGGTVAMLYMATAVVPEHVPPCKG
jgi:hypothetical protein